jgi:hypothetical protein
LTLGDIEKNKKEPSLLGLVNKIMMISLCVPTRQRPDNITRLCYSVFNKAKHPSQVEVIFYIDHDDNRDFVEETITLLQEEFINVKYIKGDRINLSKMWNMCAENADGDIFMHGGDDITINTQDWDEIVRNAFQEEEDNIWLVYGDDLLQGEKLATHGFYHRDWYETLGYLTAPYFSSDYCDTWNDEVARYIGRIKYVPHLITEHHHFTNNKANLDINTIERLQRHKADNVNVKFEELRDERIKDAEKLKNFLKKGKE